MKSKGGKREYLCPICYSKNICQGKYHTLSVGICNQCNSWWYPWAKRIKIKAGEQYIVKKNTRKRLTIIFLAVTAIALLIGPLLLATIKSTGAKSDYPIMTHR